MALILCRAAASIPAEEWQHSWCRLRRFWRESSARRSRGLPGSGCRTGSRSTSGLGTWWWWTMKAWTCGFLQWAGASGGGAQVGATCFQACRPEIAQVHLVHTRAAAAAALPTRHPLLKPHPYLRLVSPLPAAQPALRAQARPAAPSTQQHQQQQAHRQRPAAQQAPSENQYSRAAFLSHSDAIGMASRRKGRGPPEFQLPEGWQLHNPAPAAGSPPAASAAAASPSPPSTTSTPSTPANK